MKLLVIIRNDAPFIHFQDPPEHRSVIIELTPEQKASVTPKFLCKISGIETYEELSTCFPKTVGYTNIVNGNKKLTIPQVKVTVLFRDERPLIYGYDCYPNYRFVEFMLTPEQNEKLKCALTTTCGDREYYEKVTQCSLDLEREENKGGK